VIVSSTTHVIPPEQVFDSSFNFTIDSSERQETEIDISFDSSFNLAIEGTTREPKGTEEEPNPKADIKLSITETEREGRAGGTTISKIYVFKSFLPPLILKFLKKPNRCL
jgi:hypothetical protein